MKLKDLKKDFITKLAITYPNEEILSIFKILCNEYLNMSAAKLLLAGEELINKKQIDMFSKAIVRLLNEEPIQYILQTTTFYGLEFICTPSALIPRPETEELVDWIIKSETNEITILDIGTGTGCISVSLANHNDFMVDALDVSSPALDLAKQNAKQNKVDVNFIEADIFEYKSDKKYDLIVSNPPYVRNLEKNKMLNNVLHFEPELALFVEDDDPLIFYRSILKFAHNNLIEKGKIYFEINEYLYNDIKGLLIFFGYVNIELKKDSFGKFRFVKAAKYAKIDNTHKLSILNTVGYSAKDLRLNGCVKTYTEIYTGFSSVTFFDKDGQCVKSEHINHKNNNKSVSHYKYDNNNKLVHYQTYNCKKELNIEVKFKYNEFNQLILINEVDFDYETDDDKKIKIYSSKEDFIYDKNNLLISRVEFSEYADKNNKIEYSTSSKSDYFYDNQFNLIKEINTDLSNGKVYSEKNNIYSDDGLLIADVQDYIDDIYSTFYEYENNERVSLVRSSKNRGVVRKWQKLEINNKEKSILKQTNSTMSEISVNEKGERDLYSYIDLHDKHSNIIKKTLLINGIIDSINEKLIEYYD